MPLDFWSSSGHAQEDGTCRNGMDKHELVFKNKEDEVEKAMRDSIKVKFKTVD